MTAIAEDVRPGMGAQAIFDHVARHLLRQGRRSESPTRKIGLGIGGLPPSDTQCRYRGDDGTSCAVGCLIPDTLYSPALEGAGVPPLTPECIERVEVEPRKPAWRWLASLFAEGDSTELRSKMAARLQTLHDSSLPEEWPDQLRTFAAWHGLSALVVDTETGARG